MTKIIFPRYHHRHHHHHPHHRNRHHYRPPSYNGMPPMLFVIRNIIQSYPGYCCVTATSFLNIRHHQSGGDGGTVPHQDFGARRCGHYIGGIIRHWDGAVRRL